MSPSLRCRWGNHMVTLEQEKLELLRDLEEYFQDFEDNPVNRGKTFYNTHPTIMLNRAMQILLKEQMTNDLVVDFKDFLTKEHPSAS